MHASRTNTPHGNHFLDKTMESTLQKQHKGAAQTIYGDMGDVGDDTNIKNFVLGNFLKASMKDGNKQNKNLRDLLQNRSFNM